VKFLEPAAFVTNGAYLLLPMRFRRLPWDASRSLITNAAGDWHVIGSEALEDLVGGCLPPTHPEFATLEARHFLARGDSRPAMAPLLSQIATRKRYLQGGPALHIVVVSLRCHHTCSYCQVSRQTLDQSAFDMSEGTADAVADRMLEWPVQHMTVEFQGGEPLLQFARIRRIVGRLQDAADGRSWRFVIATTLNDVSDEQLEFCRLHGIHLSTSLDGPAWLHDANRPRPGRDSHARTIAGIERARERLGHDAIAALTTLTARSLEAPEAIIDEYRRLGLRSIFLRPLSLYGFARKTATRTGYAMPDFLAFYRRALDYILRINREGYALEEAYASLLLGQLLTPFSHGYVDLRSPTGAGFGVMVYDYDGGVYPADEARMLASMGDRSLRLGSVHDSRTNWLKSPVMQKIAEAGVAECLPGCSDCVYVPLCGADPIDHYARSGDLVGHRADSDFCRRQMGLFDELLYRLIDGPEADRRILERWAQGAVASQSEAVA